MRVVFKIISIIGVLSFFGGLKNGVFFIFGLIIAGIFGYLGWWYKQNNNEGSRKEKIKENLSSKKYSEINQANFRNVMSRYYSNGLSENQLKSQIDSFTHKKELLESSYKDGLFNWQDFFDKKEEIDKELMILKQILQLKINSPKILSENKDAFNKLSQLKLQGIITNEEYQNKYDELLIYFLEKLNLDSNLSMQSSNTSSLKNEKSFFDSIYYLILIVGFIAFLFLLVRHL
jgi:hypothetical protein